MKRILSYIALFIAIFINRVEYFLKNEFDSPNYEQILFHLDFAGEKIDFDIDILYLFIKKCFLMPLIIVFLFYCIDRFLKFKINKNILLILNFVLLSISSIFLLIRISFFQSYDNANYIDQNYIFSNQIKAPVKKDNLILIYVESLENTYQDKNLFNKNLLENLDIKTKDWTTFPQYKQNFGGVFTMGAIVSTQCGIPLRPASNYDKKLKKGDKILGNEIGEVNQQFLPNAVCLGDILKNDGYSNIFLGGADSKFAGKGKFLKQHGYDLIIGRPEWEARGETSMNNWGLFDDVLFKNAKNEIDNIYATGKPFNLTLLTVDTHHPSGHLSQYCKAHGVVNLEGVVECTGNLIVDFVNYVEAKGYTKNTNIIIIGDHLAMSNSVSHKLKTVVDRNIYNKIYSVNNIKINRDKIYQISMFPTILNLLNYDIPNGRLALGASGVSTEVSKDYKVENEKNVSPLLTETLGSKSELMKYFWNEK